MQEQELTRVTARIGAAVVTFCTSLGVGGTFHADDLRRSVHKAVTAAPGSPDRVLRDLRKRGILDYIIVSRPSSLYRVTRLPKKGKK